MRIPIGLGFAIGCIALVATQHAFSKSGGRYYRTEDSDLTALERLGAQAKKAMDAFVLRPRMPDAYDSVCSGCMRGNEASSLTRVARAPIAIPTQAHAVAAMDGPRPRRSRYVALLRKTYQRQATRIRQTFTHRGRQIRQRIGFVPRSAAGESWESELRR